MVSKCLSRSLKSIPADHAGSEFEEGFIDRRQLLVADSKTVDVMEPCTCAFDYAAVLSKATSVDGAPLRENRVNAPIAQSLPVWFGVVSTVSVDDLGLLQGSPANATNSWDRVYERQQFDDVVAIGPVGMIGRGTPFASVAT